MGCSADLQVRCVCRPEGLHYIDGKTVLTGLTANEEHGVNGITQSNEEAEAHSAKAACDAGLPFPQLLRSSV